MYKFVLTNADFDERLRDYRLGRIDENEFLRRFFFENLDMDYAEAAASKLDSALRDRIVKFMEDSPSTEDHWTTLCTLARKRAADRIREPDYPEDGFGDKWVFNFDPGWESLDRYQVYSLRVAFGLPIHELDWSDTLLQHKSLIDECKLPAWAIQSRVHWYAFLHSYSAPCRNFNDAPSEDIWREWQCLKIGHFIARLQLIESMHPSFFFNFRRRTLTQLQNTWAISEIGILRRADSAG